MKLTDLQLENYRNYQHLQLHFSPNLNIFVGENAQGKTNLLESIYVLALTRSHRSHREKEFIRWGAEYARILGTVQKAQHDVRLEMDISTKGRKTKINRLEQKKLSNYVGQLNVVLFAPEDLSLIKGAPQIRRRFIDMELGQVDPHYLYHLTVYQKVLKQRNKYLKQLSSNKTVDATYLDILSEQLAAAGSQVLFLRYQFLAQLEQWAKDIHAGITKQQEELTLLYVPSFPVQSELSLSELEQAFYTQLQANTSQDLFKQATSVGPHRDDLSFFINGQNVQTYGSQGQQRTAALSLKLAEIELIQTKTGEYPLLLLDDVLSELDDERQVHLLQTIEGKVQTFITTTSLSHLKSKLTTQPTVYHVHQGQVERNEE